MLVGLGERQEPDARRDIKKTGLRWIDFRRQVRLMHPQSPNPSRQAWS
jgi:hypothetical protein